MRKNITRVLSITFLLMISLFVFNGPSVEARPGGNNSIEPPDGGSAYPQIINTFESVYIDYYAFEDGSFQLYQQYYFDVYISRPSTTHQYVDESENIYLRPSDGNTYFSDGYYKLDGYIDIYDLEDETTGAWLVDYYGDLAFYSYDSINDFHASKHIYLYNYTGYDTYTSYSAFAIRNVIYTNETISGYFFGYSKGGTTLSDDSFLFVDRVYYQSEGFGNYYIIEDGYGIELDYKSIGYYELEFFNIASYQLNPETFTIPNIYFIEF